MCPSSAFIEEKEYEIPPLLSKDDRDFHLWVGENYAPKYPLLKNAYSDLLECWLHYHPKEKPRP